MIQGRNIISHNYYIMFYNFAVKNVNIFKTEHNQVVIKFTLGRSEKVFYASHGYYITESYSFKFFQILF